MTTTSDYTVTLPFRPGQRVRLKPLDRLVGRVWVIELRIGQIYYDCRYFHNGKIEHVLLLEDDLEAA